MGANKTYQQKGDRGRMLGESDEFKRLRHAVEKRPFRPNGTENGYVFFHSANTRRSKPSWATLRQDPRSPFTQTLFASSVMCCGPFKKRHSWKQPGPKPCQADRSVYKAFDPRGQAQIRLEEARRRQSLHRTGSLSSYSGHSAVGLTAATTMRNCSNVI